MASRLFFDVKSYLKKETRVAFSFLPQGAGAPLLNLAAGKAFPAIASIARTGAGAFLITFNDAFPLLVAHSASVRLNAVADIVAQFGAYTPATATAKATLVLTLLAAAVPTDVAANANNVVSCDLVFSNISIDP